MARKTEKAPAGRAARGAAPPRVARGRARPAGSEQLRSTFRRRAEALIQRLSDEASDSVIEEALAAPSDFGGLARLLSDTAAVGVDLRTVDPLAEAVARGAEAKQELLRQAGGAWSSSRVGELLGITRQAVDKRRRTGRLLAVRNAQGDHVFPVCQFADGGVLTGLEAFLAAFKTGGPWVQLSVLVSPAEEIGGVSPLEALRAGRTDEAAMVAGAYGEQGGPAGTGR